MSTQARQVSTGKTAVSRQMSTQTRVMPSSTQATVKILLYLVVLQLLSLKRMLAIFHIQLKNTSFN